MDSAITQVFSKVIQLRKLSYRLRLAENCCDDCWVQCTDEWGLKQSGKHKCFKIEACGHMVCDLTSKVCPLSCLREGGFGVAEKAPC